MHGNKWSAVFCFCFVFYIKVLIKTDLCRCRSAVHGQMFVDSSMKALCSKLLPPPLKYECVSEEADDGTVNPAVTDSGLKPIMSTCSPLTPEQFDELSSWESSLTAHGKTPSRHTCCSCPPRAARHVLWITSSGSGHVLNKYGFKIKIRNKSLHLTCRASF